MNVAAAAVAARDLLDESNHSMPMPADEQLASLADFMPLHIFPENNNNNAAPALAPGPGLVAAVPTTTTATNYPLSGINNTSNVNIGSCAPPTQDQSAQIYKMQQQQQQQQQSNNSIMTSPITSPIAAAALTSQQQAQAQAQAAAGFAPAPAPAAICDFAAPPIYNDQIIIMNGNMDITTMNAAGMNATTNMNINMNATTTNVNIGGIANAGRSQIPLQISVPGQQQAAAPASATGTVATAPDPADQTITTPLMSQLFGLNGTVNNGAHQAQAQHQIPTRFVNLQRTKSTSNVYNNNNPNPTRSKKRPSDSDLSSATSSTTASKKAKTGSYLQNSSFGAKSPTLLGRKLVDVVDLNNEQTDGTRKYAYQQVVGSSKISSPKDQPAGTKSPQDYLNSILKERSYSTETSTSFGCGYPSQPTALQRSSYGTAVLRAVQKSDNDALSALLKAGLSPNPCNAHGDSILHMVCKRSDYKLFQTFVDNGAAIEVADPFGRTPLHHAAWAPASDATFQIVTAMLDNVGSSILRVADKTGKTPLQYLTVDKWAKWVAFLESKREVYFPERGPADDDSAAAADGPPRSSTFLKKDGPIMEDLAVLDPPNALSPEIAAQVASGKVKPEDVMDRVINITPEAVAIVSGSRGSSPCA